MDQNSLQAMLNALIQSIGTYETAQRSSLDRSRENQFQQINNTANSRGLLYSSLPRFLDTQFDTTKYIPSVAKLYSGNAKTKFSQQQYYQTAIDKINAYNQAAAKLGG